jgi:membrane protein required for beta-lactamase induction
MGHRQFVNPRDQRFGREFTRYGITREPHARLSQARGRAVSLLLRCSIVVLVAVAAIVLITSFGPGA